jgi:hypothetical protein
MKLTQLSPVQYWFVNTEFIHEWAVRCYSKLKAINKMKGCEVRQGNIQKFYEIVSK